jgi:hypothetical protein
MYFLLKLETVVSPVSFSNFFFLHGFSHFHFLDILENGYLLFFHIVEHMHCRYFLKQLKKTYTVNVLCGSHLLGCHMRTINMKTFVIRYIVPTYIATSLITVITQYSIYNHFFTLTALIIY